ncbi:cadmium resistance transporter [Paucisalibacillus sp. EB02]|uniref:cadmium resistance transporter n=1 Tax=Paucisalibacillus sp. EB02 TaxID=1347087 RepID=UPI0004AC7D44|nr:cadmium resistance transporter [Paucisalibacillus sp. EB02]
MATIMTMIITFIATGIDEMLVLILLFAHARNQKQIRQVYIGQQIGMTFILVLAIIAISGISSFAGKWTGLLGLLPIIIGVMELMENDEDNESPGILNKISMFSNLTLRVAIIAVVGGAEELAIYVPYFTSLTWNEIILAIITFLIMIPIWCGIWHMVGSMKNIYRFVKRFQRILIPVVFIGIGMKVLLESDTIEAIIDLFI